MGKVYFNSKHLRKGDPLPPYNGKLRIYNMRYCPWAHRTMLALIAKQIDFEVVNINLMVSRPEWLQTKSAFGKVPALEIEEGVTIFESLVTVEYLDEAYSQRPLLAKDPLRRAQDKIIIEATSPLRNFYYKVLKLPDTVTEEDVASYHKTLDYVQNQLKTRGTKFLHGNEPGYVDYMIWPWVERLRMTELDPKSDIDGNKYKLFLEYVNRMFQDPAVSEYLVPREICNEFLKPYKSGDLSKLNYDLLTGE